MEGAADAPLTWSIKKESCLHVHLFGVNLKKTVTFDLSVEIQFHFHNWVSRDEFFKTRSHIDRFRRTFFKATLGPMKATLVL